MKSNKKISRDQIRELVKNMLNRELNNLDPKPDGPPNHKVLMEMIAKEQMEKILKSISQEEEKEEEEKEEGVSDE